MPEHAIPEAAVTRAAEAIHRDTCPLDEDHDATGIDRRRAVAALEAAAPILAKGLLYPLLERHPRIEGEWGPSCGTCWIKSGSRAGWPCAEVLAISVLLPLPDDDEDEVSGA